MGGPPTNADRSKLAMLPSINPDDYFNNPNNSGSSASAGLGSSAGAGSDSSASADSGSGLTPEIKKNFSLFLAQVEEQVGSKKVAKTLGQYFIGMVGLLEEMAKLKALDSPVVEGVLREMLNLLGDMSRPFEEKRDAINVLMETFQKDLAGLLKTLDPDTRIHLMTSEDTHAHAAYLRVREGINKVLAGLKIKMDRLKDKEGWEERFPTSTKAIALTEGRAVKKSYLLFALALLGTFAHDLRKLFNASEMTPGMKALGSFATHPGAILVIGAGAAWGSLWWEEMSLVEVVRKIRRLWSSDSSFDEPEGKTIERPEEEESKTVALPRETGKSQAEKIARFWAMVTGFLEIAFAVVTQFRMDEKDRWTPLPTLVVLLLFLVIYFVVLYWRLRSEFAPLDSAVPKNMLYRVIGYVPEDPYQRFKSWRTKAKKRKVRGRKRR